MTFIVQEVQARLKQKNTLLNCCEKKTGTEVELHFFGKVVWARVPGTRLAGGTFLGELARIGVVEDDKESRCAVCTVDMLWWNYLETICLNIERFVRG